MQPEPAVGDAEPSATQEFAFTVRVPEDAGDSRVTFRADAADVLTEQHLVRLEREDGLPRIVIRRWNDGEEHAISFPEEAYSLGLSVGYEYDTHSLRFTYSSMTTPAQVYDYDMESRERVLRKTQEVPSGHNPDDYVTRRVMAPAKDGETVPVWAGPDPDSLFRVDEAVTDRRGNFLPDLTDADFEIFEDDKKQTLKYFTRGTELEAGPEMHIGLLFDTIEGGFTFTGRSTPNAFNVLPNVVYRIYADGRPTELVRGVDLIGTPLAAFSKILAASDAVDVFNGLCGAESGSVPVSASSPSLLVSEVEVQKKAQSQETLPILPAPTPRRKS